MSGWDDFNEYKENRPTGGGFWIKLADKENTRLRFYSEPHAINTIWVKDRTGKNMKIVNPSEDLVSRINQARGLAGTRNELKPRRTWLILALNKDEGRCGIYEAPFQVMSNLAEFRDMEEFGKNLARYDVVINKDSDRNPTYTANAMPPKDLTDEERTLMREFRDMVNLDEQTADTPEEDVVNALGLPSPGASASSSASDDDFESSLSSGSSNSEEDFLDI
jgi:hypothetical protein